MKASSLRMCDGCGGSLLKRGIGCFYVVTSSGAMVNPSAYNATAGLAQMFGGSMAIAEAMSPDPEVVTVFGEKDPTLMNQLMLCIDCYAGKPLAQIVEEKI